MIDAQQQQLNNIVEAIQNADNDKVIYWALSEIKRKTLRTMNNMITQLLNREEE